MYDPGKVLNFLREFKNNAKTVISLSLASGKDDSLILYESLIQYGVDNWSSDGQTEASFSPFRRETLIESVKNRSGKHRFEMVGKLARTGKDNCVWNEKLQADLCTLNYVYYDKIVSSSVNVQTLCKLLIFTCVSKNI